MYKIGELSRLSQVPIRTLRYYDQIGLLVPAQVDRSSGYRCYAAEQLSGSTGSEIQFPVERPARSTPAAGGHAPAHQTRSSR
jgi:hypothetical protein